VTLITRPADAKFQAERQSSWKRLFEERNADFDAADCDRLKVYSVLFLVDRARRARATRAVEAYLVKANNRQPS